MRSKMTTIDGNLLQVKRNLEYLEEMYDTIFRKVNRLFVDVEIWSLYCQVSKQWLNTSDLQKIYNKISHFKMNLSKWIQRSPVAACCVSEKYFQDLEKFLMINLINILMFTCQLWELQSFPLLWICLQQLLVVWSSGCANHWCWRWCLQPWVRSRQDCCQEHSSLQAATSHPRNRSRDFKRGKCLQTISLRHIILVYLNVPTDQWSYV